MLIIKTSSDLKDYLEVKKKNGKTIGFVPTMGALHPGHLSLVKRAKAENDIACVSIFVNPTQFNNKDDLTNYPRMELQDTRMLKDTHCDVLFMPDVDDMYPVEDTSEFDLGGLDKPMEGKFRKGHFNGVAQIVSKLFVMVKPNRAYFGKKDFQQLAIIIYLNNTVCKHLNIQIIGCQTIREPDGLAMSSRNLLLSTEERLSAPLISKTLKDLVSQKYTSNVQQMKQLFLDTINKDPHLQTEYIEIVNDNTLLSVDKIVPGSTSVCVAVYCGKIRLIDNMQFE